MVLKKLAVLGITFVLVLTLIAGCGSGGGGTAPKPEESASASGVVDEEKPILKMLMANVANVDLNSDICAKDIEATTGYKVEYSMLPQDKPDEKLNMEIAAGVEYDIIKIPPDLYRKLVGQGAFIELDGLLEEYGSNIKEATNPDYWNLTQYNGKTYGIPYVTERPNIDGGLAIRQDILDELGLGMPETTEEFYNVLKTIKEKKNMIPFTAAATTNVPTLLSGFGIADGGGGFAQDINGKLEWTFTVPQYKDYLSYMTKLYKEGLLDPDWAINKVANRDEKFTAGKAAVTTYSWYDATKLKPALLKNVPAAKISVINPFKDKKGEAGVYMAQSLNTVITISKTSRNKEHAVKWMNIKQQPDNFVFLSLGTEGVTFKVEDGNKYIPIMPALTEQRGNAYCYLTSKDDKKYADMWLARTRRDPALGEAFDEFNKDVDKYGKTSPVWDMPALPSITKNQQNLNKLFEDNFIKTILGSEKVEDWDNFIARWRNEGGSDMEKEINEWYQSRIK
ncbi:extracellular solute-binding protein [Ruminiclostridium cellobioparum]|uniref:extracellular solute-binding protein n=1 Tax=Ruminiclostridium cellobioparum TaxID=29355 RepID=UPI0006859974|nr:extracellular solute-binding protein [Ruminiclostridium cellobioparum]